MLPSTDELWRFLPWGYLLTVLFETPILWVGLAPRHSAARRLAAGVLLTACTYPIVILVLPLCVWAPYGEAAYLAVAETFAPLAEIALFWAWTWPAASDPADAPERRLLPPGAARDAAAILAANLASFLFGEWLLGG